MGEKAVKEAIEGRSRAMVDPAGRELRILEDSQAQALAVEAGITVHRVYMEALSQGVYPCRYIRNRDSISLEEQLTLGRSRVAVIGAGGLGGGVILLLARVGIGYLTVVDHDRFDETNLNRQALSTTGAIGRFKAQWAASVVASINPGVVVTPCAVRLERGNAREILEGSNVVVDALDNIGDRLLLEETVRELQVPLVHGALAGFEGQLMTLFPEDPGLRPIYGEPPPQSDKSKSPEAILGVPGLMPSFLGTLQAMEVIKILLNRGRLFRKVLLHMDLETGEMNEFSLHGHEPRESEQAPGEP